MSTEFFHSLEARRRSLGISFPALAERSGISMPTLKRIFAGEVSPTVEKLQAMAAVLGVEFRVNGAIEVIPSKSVEQVRRAVAEEKAEWLVRLVQGTSALEGQAVDQGTVHEMIELTVLELLSGPNRKLWAR